MKGWNEDTVGTWICALLLIVAGMCFAFAWEYSLGRPDTPKDFSQFPADPTESPYWRHDNKADGSPDAWQLRSNFVPGTTDIYCTADKDFPKEEMDLRNKLIGCKWYQVYGADWTAAVFWVRFAIGLIWVSIRGLCKGDVKDGQ